MDNKLIAPNEITKKLYSKKNMNDTQTIELKFKK